jgi:soluble lytic murein transglycosylase
VSAVASAHGLEPSLPYGVMVAESALKPEVTSPAGARGLMQLMPEVGATLHPTLFPHRPYDPDDLYNAPYNAALGTAELGQRARSLAGVLQTTDLPAVVASYNAGEQAVRRWLEPYDEPPPFDAWAEAISYTETRRYVKRVLGHAMAVRWVYGDADPGSPK